MELIMCCLTCMHDFDPKIFCHYDKIYLSELLHQTLHLNENDK